MNVAICREMLHSEINKTIEFSKSPSYKKMTNVTPM